MEGLERRALLAVAVAEYTLGSSLLNLFGTSGTLPGIAAGPDGNLYYTSPDYARVGRLTPAGVTSPVASLSQGSTPGSIAAGPDGNLWIAEGGIGRIARLTTSGAVTEFPAGTNPTGIAAGPDGNLWFTDTTAGAIGRITTDGVVAEFPLALADAYPTAIALGPDGNLWFTESGKPYFTTPGGHKIGRITPAGVITEFALPDAGMRPDVITAGPDGNLWFADSGFGRASAIGRITTAGAIATYSLPDADARIGGIAPGPDGNVWFTESEGGRSPNKVGYITPAGAITEVPLPSGVGEELRPLGEPARGGIDLDPPQAPLGGITLGPRGHLWFTELDQVGEAIKGVTDAPMTANAVVLDAVAGQEFAAVVAHFSDADPAAGFGNYRVTIDWGDGTFFDANPGVLRPDGHGGYDVLGQHEYSPTDLSGNPIAATYRVTVSIFDRQAVGSIPTTVVGTARVAASDSFQNVGLTFSQDRPGHVTLTDTFNGFNYTPSPVVSGTIDWGDGTPPAPATVASVLRRMPYTTLTGDHFYAKAGVYIVRLTTVPSATFSRLIILGSSGLTADPVPVSVPAGLTATNTPVATFHVFNQTAPAGLAAKIYWGDGTAPVDGVVTRVGDAYQVSGSHTFATPGRYTYGVAVTAADGQIAITIGTAVVGGLNERFVAQAYLDLVARPVDPESLAYWTAAMDNGLSSYRVALALKTSREGRTLDASRLYQKLLGAPAPSWVLEAFVNFLSEGGTPERLEALVIATDAYAQAHGAVTNAGFEAALIQEAYHRAPDANELRVMEEAFSIGLSRADIAWAFLTTPEARINQSSELLSSLIGPRLTSYDPYQDLLAGTSEDWIVAAIVTSTAYLSKL